MTSALASPRVRAVLQRLHDKADREDRAAKERVRAQERELGVRLAPAQRYELYGDAPLAISREVGALYHLLITGQRARSVVEFGMSHGISTIYLAAALADLGGGWIITTEILPGKADAARQNLMEAGLSDLVEIRVGDALQTLKSVPDEIDVLVLDGRNDQYVPVFGLVQPRLSASAVVLADLGRDDPDLQYYQEYVRDPASGLVSIELPLDAGIEVSVRIAADTGARQRTADPPTASMQSGRAAAAGPDDVRDRLRALRVFAGEMPSFETDRAPAHPAELFLEWLLAAIDVGVREPHAMTLSTVDQAGRPTSRVLILKGLLDGQWQFASSATSRKGRELAANPWAAINFYWSELGRQVRIRGRVTDAGPAASARDFLARPVGSRAEALAGRQSDVLTHPQDLDDALAEARSRVEADRKLVAEHWTLYHLIPDEIEFWQADPERRHTRLRYVLQDSRWTQQALWP